MILPDNLLSSAAVNGMKLDIVVLNYLFPIILKIKHSVLVIIGCVHKN